MQLDTVGDKTNMIESFITFIFHHLASIAFGLFFFLVTAALAYEWGYYDGLRAANPNTFANLNASDPKDRSEDDESDDLF